MKTLIGNTRRRSLRKRIAATTLGTILTTTALIAQDSPSTMVSLTAGNTTFTATIGNDTPKPITAVFNIMSIPGNPSETLSSPPVIVSPHTLATTSLTVNLTQSTFFDAYFTCSNTTSSTPGGCPTKSYFLQIETPIAFGGSISQERHNRDFGILTQFPTELSQMEFEQETLPNLTAAALYPPSLTNTLIVHNGGRYQCTITSLNPFTGSSIPQTYFTITVSPGSTIATDQPVNGPISAIQLRFGDTCSNIQPSLFANEPFEAGGGFTLQPLDFNTGAVRPE